MSEDAYKKAFEREREARKEAERITEAKSRELFELNTALKKLNEGLEERIRERTSELEAARNKAEANTRAKSEFLSMMSHEMRSPLNVIVGLTELLDLSAIEAGKIAFESTPFDLTYAVDQVFYALEQRAIDKGLTWSKSMPDDLPAPLKGDAAKLNQVLINLLDNAIKFTRDGGVEMRLTQVERQEKENVVWVAVEVSDTGKGISE